MNAQVAIVLVVAGVLYGLLVRSVAGRLGRSRWVWGLAGAVAGPLVLPVLLFVGPTRGLVGVVRRWVLVLVVVLGTLGGAAVGASLFLERHFVHPSKVVRQVGKRITPETDGPTASAISMVGNTLFAAIGAICGGVAGFVVSPGLVVAAERAFRKH